MTEDIKRYLSSLGKKGGSKKSERKAATARENGKKGGRPKTIDKVSETA